MQYLILALFFLALGCGDDTTPAPMDGGADSGAATDSGASTDAGRDASNLTDAGAADAGIETSDAAVGASCVFNRDCAATQRCGCDEGLCLCEVGPRGTGINGVDLCTDENDCASAVCAEGPGGTFYCSGECADEGDCTGMLPICLPVAGLGPICARDPDA